VKQTRLATHPNTPGLAAHEPRTRRDAALDIARYALARIADGDPDPRQLARKALDDLETLCRPLAGDER
jgi:hypothetical protein